MAYLHKFKIKLTNTQKIEFKVKLTEGKVFRIMIQCIDFSVNRFSGNPIPQRVQRLLGLPQG